jgi:serine/threonine protein kinase
VPEPLPEGWSLAELLARQSSRWRCGDCTPVEDYVAALPALQEDAPALIRLIANELALRAEKGDSPCLEEYLRRFPTLEERELRPLFSFSASGATPRTERSTQAAPADERTPAPPPARARKMPDVPGYEILEYIEASGQGEMYKVRHVRLARTVALKILRDQTQLDEQHLARFHREGKLSARLDHPNIIRIYDSAEWQGRLYFSMEFAEGGSLKCRLGRQHHLTPAAAAELVGVLAGAVQHAHDQGIVHRDLKQGNVLFMQDGTPKIADFGLAKRVAGHATELMQTRTVLGSAGYMAPEQAAGGGGGLPSPPTSTGWVRSSTPRSLAARSSSARTCWRCSFGCASSWPLHLRTDGREFPPRSIRFASSAWRRSRHAAIAALPKWRGNSAATG